MTASEALERAALFCSILFLAACTDDPEPADIADLPAEQDGQSDPPDEPPATDVDLEVDGDPLEGDRGDDADTREDPVDTSDEDYSPLGVICRPCLTSDQCDTTGNVCLTLPSRESVCGLDCAANPDICPDSTFCAQFEIDQQTVSQCIPQSLHCIDLCSDPPVSCPEAGQVCDPLTGECGPLHALCESCLIDEHCGPGNYCITFPDIDQTRACGRACTATGNECPQGYFCAALDEMGTTLQCVPEILTCVDRCLGITCDDETICNPLSGDCEAPLAPCEPCLLSSQCGGQGDLCITLLDGEAYCGQDCSATAGVDEGVCPPGDYCHRFSETVSQCIPTILTCVDHCILPEPVQCLTGSNCEPTDGTCHPSLYDLCQGPCDYNYECVGQDDLCIAFSITTGTFCGIDCDAEDPCPVGYSCYALSDNLNYQCGPADYELGCTPCRDTVCPDGEYCRPVDGTCLGRPTACTGQTDCLLAEVCNLYDDRCEPIGLSCRYDEYWDCPYGAACSAPSLNTWGTCLLECSARPEGCPDTAPACGNFYRPWWDVCVERGLGGPERCGRLVAWDQVVGRPCPYSDTYTGCATTADVCLTEVIPGQPGFCTSVCDPDAADPCPYGGRCASLPGVLEPYCLPEECECLALPGLDEGELDVLQQALDALALDRCDLASTWAERETAGPDVANDPFRIEIAGRVKNEPLAGAAFARRQLDILGNGGSLAQAIALAADDLGHPVNQPYPSFDAYDLCSAIQSLFTDSGTETPTCEELAEPLAQVPADMKPGLTRVIAAAGWAIRQRDFILPPALDGEALDAFVAALPRLLLEEPSDPPLASEVHDIITDLDFTVLYTAAAALATTVETASLQPDRGEPPAFLTIDVKLETPRGLIVIEGDDDHTYCSTAGECADADHPVVLGQSVLLLIDTAGHDEYRIPAGAATGRSSAVSLLLDLGGDDDYGYVPAAADPHAGELYPADSDGRAQAPLPPVSLSSIGRQGSARGGIGFLFDLGSSADTYMSLRFSQGFGLLGVGALVDDGCSLQTGSSCPDRLRSEAASQGTGLFGIGLLLLGDGAAHVEGYHLVQGAGGPLGLGLLLDAGGDDRYTAIPGDAEDILYSAPVGSTPGNFSAAQAVGIGVPGDDPAEGGNLSGGIGLLVELGGDDVYIAGTMSQGAGYRHGLGALVEVTGNDRYSALGDAQGAGLDFGAGCLVERAGADVYNQPESVARHLLGSGEDFGVGLAIDEGGSDLYQVGGQSLGVGFFNGIGIFIENEGADEYRVTSADTLGKATLSVLGSEPPDNPRRTARTIGLFVDAQGTDLYSGRSLDSPPIGEGLIWIQRTPLEADEPALIEWGIGADGQGGTGVGTVR